MGWYDYLTDLTSSLSFSDAYADDQSRGAPQGQDMAPDHSTGEDVKGGGVGSAQQDRGAGTKGGVSDGMPAAGTDEESSSEKEANAGDAESAKQRSSGEGEKGYTPGEGGEASGQVGKENAGPHGGSVGGDDDEEEEDEEEEEEEEEEPEDIKPKLEEGESHFSYNTPPFKIWNC